MAVKNKKTTTPAKAVSLALATHRIMSDAVLINSAAFDKLSSADRSTLMSSITTNTEGGPALPLQFIPNFTDLSSSSKLRDELLAGNDVSRRLEFNGITLDPDEVKALSAFNSIMDKITSLVPAYPWVLKDTDDFSNRFTINRSTLHRADRQMGKAKFKTIWKAASRFWFDGTKPDRITHRHADGYYTTRTRTVEITNTGITIGCQSFTRAEVEWLAKQLDYEPNVL